MKKVLIPLPRADFEPSEAAVPWKYMTAAGHEVTFATPHGKPSTPDQPFLTGKGFGPLRRIFSTNPHGVNAYYEMERSDAFQNPISYDAIKGNAFNAVCLPGGHAHGIREYLESPVLQELVADYFARGSLVGAICHGVVLPARSTSRTTGKSVLHGRKTTSLLPIQENTGWLVTRLWMGDYFKTYRGRTVRSEVESSLASKADFLPGPLPMKMDSPDNLAPGFVVVDDNYISGRWPGDAHRFGSGFVNLLSEDRF